MNSVFHLSRQYLHVPTLASCIDVGPVNRYDSECVPNVGQHFFKLAIDQISLLIARVDRFFKMV